MLTSFISVMISRTTSFPIPFNFKFQVMNYNFFTLVLIAKNLFNKLRSRDFVSTCINLFILILLCKQGRITPPAIPQTQRVLFSNKQDPLPSPNSTPHIKIKFNINLFLNFFYFRSRDSTCNSTNTKSPSFPTNSRHPWPQTHQPPQQRTITYEQHYTSMFPPLPFLLYLATRKNWISIGKSFQNLTWKSTHVSAIFFILFL